MQIAPPSLTSPWDAIGQKVMFRALVEPGYYHESNMRSLYRERLHTHGGGKIVGVKNLIVGIYHPEHVSWNNSLEPGDSEPAYLEEKARMRVWKVITRANGRVRFVCPEDMRVEGGTWPAQLPSVDDESYWVGTNWITHQQAASSMLDAGWN